MEERRTQGRNRRKRTPFAENINNADAEFDEIRSRINSNRPQGTTRVNLNDLNPTELESQIQDHAVRKTIQRYDAIQALETVTDTRVSHMVIALRNLSIIFQTRSMTKVVSLPR